MSTIYEPDVDPYARYDQLPGGIRNDHAITTAVPTGYYPDARQNPGAPLYQGAADAEYNAGFPVEMFDCSERLDQHPAMHVAATWTPSPDGNGRRTGTRDALESGPARPDTMLLSLFEYRGAGTGRTRYMDVPDGREFSPYGSQDGSEWVPYQDAAAALAPLDTSQSPVPQDPSQPPRAQSTQYRLPPGPSHGWTSTPVANVREVDNRKATKQLRQQKSPHQDRLANSTYAGQTYSQRTATVQQAGAAGQAVNDPWRERG
jgi:hypothetical protein